MKVAVCFSGQLRYVKEYSQYILPHLIQQYEKVDVYAHLWYSEEMLGKPFHHEFLDEYKESPDEFIQIYSPKNYVFEKQYIHAQPISTGCNERDLQSMKPEDRIQSIYRIFSQWYSVKKCYELIENPEEYDFIIRLRTDAFIQKPILLKEFDKSILYVQSGRGAGYDRRFCDWFALGGPDVMKKYCLETYNDVFTYYQNGIIHMHHFMELSLSKYKNHCLEYDFSIPINHAFYKIRK
jgi:DNA-binding Lrp family transcriptional regulator